MAVIVTELPVDNASPQCRRGYQTKTEQVAIRGVDNLHIRSLLDKQQYADPNGEAAAAGFSSANWSLFGVLWPSARQLAAHMAGRPMVAGQRILEVGCGLALASMVCHRRGVDVTASDAHPLALSFLMDNLRLNDLPPLTYRHGDWAADPDKAIHDMHPVVRGRFDVIMGSDVLYERDEGGNLTRFIERHAMPHAEVLIVDPNRGNRTPFIRRMSVMGFALAELPLSEAQDNGVPYKGRLLAFSR
ncbi:MAG: SAM-dependent methyltransferase [Burkholderiales bacterium]|nr:SAM-dependent methyltransferase [Burkholderiales bacterium]MDE2434364.1 SAM-dependent methyltransferase [Burkholderiales bacterium]